MAGPFTHFLITDAAKRRIGGTLNYEKGHMRSEVHKTINCCINIHCSRRLRQRSRNLFEVIT